MPPETGSTAAVGSDSMGPLDQPANRSRAGSTDEADLKDPLLRLHTDTAVCQQQHAQYQHQHQTSSARITSKTATAPCSAEPVDLGWNFARRIWRILVLIKAAPALFLIFLAVSEAVITSHIGTISSAFYKVFIDGQQSKVVHVMLWSGGCYAATTLFFTIKSALQDYFAWRWRARLTLHLQQLYCSNSAFYLLQGVDNPDQRLSQDLPLLMSSLTETLGVLAAAPFNVVWYTLLTYQVFESWLPVAAAYAFFAVGLWGQQLLMKPVAAMVYKQEAAEGSYRYKQMRLRAWAEEIALYRSAPLEQQHLELQLVQVLSCEAKLLLRRAVLTASTKSLEYSGLVVNFGCLAYAVFSGAWDVQKTTPGGLAAKISVASFYLLTLIYSFTQVLDLANKVSDLAGLTARVGQLLEHLQDLQPAATCYHHQQHCTAHHQQQQQQCTKYQLPGWGPDRQTPHRKQPGHIGGCSVQDQEEQQQQQQQQQLQSQPMQLVGDGTAPSHKRYASQAVTLLSPQLLLVHADTYCMGTGQQQQQQQHKQQWERPGLEAPSSEASCSSSSVDQQQQQQHVMQVSAHSLGADVLMHEVRRAFPDSPRLAPLAAVVTMQFCGTARQLMLRQWQQQQQQQQGLSRACTTGGATVPGEAASQQQQQLSPRREGSSPLPAWRLPGGAASTGHAAAAAATATVTTAAGALSQQQQQQGSASPWPEAAVAADDGCPCGGHLPAAEGGGCSGLCSTAEMQTMLHVFLAWQEKVCCVLKARGYWADVVDPRTGQALCGTAGAAYDEVIGAKVLLGYATLHQHTGSCPLIQHPLAGTQVYPATLFTSAPLPSVKAALRAAEVAAGPPPAQPVNTLETSTAMQGGTATSNSSAGSSSSSSSTAQQQLRAATASAVSSSILPPAVPYTITAAKAPAGKQHADQGVQQLLSCVGLSVSTPSGVPIVKDLTLSLAAAAAAAGGTSAVSLLIRGPSGCGKSTLLKCFAGMWPADAGRCILPGAVAEMLDLDVHATNSAAAAAAGGGGVMFVPQRMLAAPGQTLRAQLAYPAAEVVVACCCVSCQCSSETCTSSSRFHSSSYSRHRDRMDHMITIAGDSPASKQQHQCKQQQKQQRCKQPLRVQVAAWWDDWLSCGIKRRVQQQQQRIAWPIKQPEHRNTLSQPQQAAAAADTSGVAAGHHHMCTVCQVLHAVLQQVGLAYLLNVLPGGLDAAAHDWGAMLSPGEMQRLGFARVLLHMPVLAILDEATSSLPADVTVELYRQLQCAGVSYVSVGHSSSLLTVHEQVLTIEGDGSGSWQLRQAHNAG